MRILFLALDVNLFGKTGDSIHVRELTNALAKVGNKVTLVGFVPEENRGDTSSLFEGMDISVKTPEKRGDTVILKFLSRTVKDFRPKVIYERRFSPKIGASLSMLHRIPLVVEINGLVNEELEILGKTKEAKRISGKLRKSLRRRFFGKAERIVAVTEGIRAGLERLYEIPSDTIVVVHNGANTDLFKPSEKIQPRKELGLDEKGIYIAFVGTLTWWQGVDDAIRALPRVRNEFPGARMIIVGDGPQRKELENLAEEVGMTDSVHFIGKVPHYLTPRYMAASDVCLAPKKVLSSGYSPLKLYEYMSCARPVVASRVPGFEILDQGAGLLFESSNPEDLAQKIVEILSDHDKMVSMGMVGRQIVEKEYSWMSVARTISGILQEVAG